MQRHPNGAPVITGVTIAAPQPQDHARFLSAFAGSPVAEPTRVPLDGGAITVWPGTVPTFVDFNVQVPNLEHLARGLRASSIAFTPRAEEIGVEADVLHGVRLSFVSQPSFAGHIMTKDAG